MNTIFLLPETWDPVLDTNGNIALAQKAYAKAQDVASAIRTFDGELWYDNTQGVPHFDEALGRVPSIALYRHSVETAAKTVPGVNQAKAFFGMSKGRILEGAVTFTDEDGIDWTIKL